MREHFHVPENYFLSHSVGCLPKATHDRLRQDYFETWAHHGGDAWPGWLQALDTFRAKLGYLLGSRAHNLCPQANVSSGLTKLLHALPQRKDKPTILCSPEDFPTTGFVFQQAKRTGYRIKYLDGDAAKLDAWDAAWDDSVGIVHITHAYSNTSKLAPVSGLCTLARERGAISILDIAQSAGAIPVDLDTWGPDFAVGTGVKFLCFGPGACFLYASEEMIQKCAPIDVGWFSHEHPFEMDIDQFRFANSAMRFFGGTPSPAPFLMAISALDLWDSLEPERVHAHIQAALERLCERVSDDILVSPRGLGTRGGAFIVNPPARDGFRNALNARQIRYDERKEGFRFSVHGYTQAEEIDRLADALSCNGISL